MADSSAASFAACITASVWIGEDGSKYFSAASTVNGTSASRCSAYSSKTVFGCPAPAPRCFSGVALEPRAARMARSIFAS